MPAVTFDDAYFHDPRTTSAAWAAQAPIHRFTSPSGTSGWLITDNELARHVLTHPDIGKSPEAMIGGESGTPRSDTRIGRIRHAAARMLVTHMLGADPPDHARLRAAVADSFTPRALARLTPDITRYTAELLDAVDPARPVDMMAALASPLPVRVICHILGLPDAHRDRIGRAGSVLSDVIVAGESELRRAAIQFATIIVPQLGWRLIRPRPDLIGSIAAQLRRGELDLAEAISTIGLLLVAGHETTASLISNTLLALLTHPDQLAAARADPDALNAAIEETLRYDPPSLTTTLRQARRPVELAGQRVLTDEWILVSLSAANHDAAVIDDPSRFDSTRPPPHRHLAFGHGIHFCLGAQLARTETRIALTELLRRYPDLALAVGPEDLRRRRSATNRRLDRLPVLLGTRRSAETG